MEHFEEKDLVKIASMYYEEGMTQAEIARKIGVSRSLISKMLLDAKAEGVIEVFINSKSAYSVSLERKLEKKYALKHAIVIDTFDLKDYEVDKMVSRAAALHLQKLTKHVKKIGMSWGKSLRGVVDQYPYTNQSEVTVLPLIGGMGIDYVDIHSNQLAYDLARKMRGKAKYLYAPALVSNQAIKDDLKGNSTIYAVLEEGKEVDLALVGISSPYHNSTMETIGYINQKDKQELTESQVIGDINSRFFQADGTEAVCPINQHVIGINLEEIRNIPTVMTVAYGEDKIKAIEVALIQKLVDIIVTTDKTATELLREEGENE